MSKNVARAMEGTNALTYSEVLTLVKGIVADQGLPDHSIRQGNVWEGKKAGVQSLSNGNNQESKTQQKTPKKDTKKSSAGGACITWNNTGSCK